MQTFRLGSSRAFRRRQVVYWQLQSPNERNMQINLVDSLLGEKATPFDSSQILFRPFIFLFWFFCRFLSKCPWEMELSLFIYCKSFFLFDKIINISLVNFHFFWWWVKSLKANPRDRTLQMHDSKSFILIAKYINLHLNSMGYILTFLNVNYKKEFYNWENGE
jgi:hypothetical protein